jgi:mRNA interferase RelE/StbE
MPPCSADAPPHDRPQDSHVPAITPTARRQLTDHLPGAVAAAAYQFITGPLLDNRHRVGKQLRPLLDDRHSARRGTYRVIHRIDDQSRTVTVVDVAHQRDASGPDQEIPWVGQPTSQRD